MRIFQHLVCAAVAAVFVIILIALQWLSEQKLEFNALGLMVLFVIPVGALVFGVIIGAVYYQVGKRLHAQADVLSMLALASLALMLQVGVYLARWIFSEVDGVPVRDIVGFVEFTKFFLGTQTYTISHHGRALGDGIELGKMGYALALLQFGGILGGASFGHIMLAGHPWCDTCDRFMQRLRKVTLNFGDEPQVFTLLSTVPGTEAWQLALPSVVGGALPVELDLYRCANCARGHLRTTPMVKNDKNQWVADGTRQRHDALDAVAQLDAQLQRAGI